MRTLRRFFKRLSYAARGQDEARLRSEIEEHLAMQTAENLRAGLSPDEARRQALLKFGGVEAMREEYRDQKGLPFLETLMQDTRQTLRRLRGAPAFTITTVLTLALGIGATTSIFTLVHAVILKSLAVANPAELYRLGKEARCCFWSGYSQETEFSLVSHDLYKYFEKNTKEFVELAAFGASERLFGVRRSETRDAAQTYSGEYVSGNYFDMFGVHAHAGRMLNSSDDRPGAAPVVVMSHRLWQERYGADPSVVGSVFNLSQKLYTVVGIAPPAFFGDSLRDPPPDFFLPLATEGDAIHVANIYWLDLIGRVRSGANPASIEAEMRVELKQWLRSHWGDMSANDRAKFPEQTLFLAPGGGGVTLMRNEYEHWLQILLIVSGFVLLIACANIANLMLVRGLERRRQISLSMALGAPARRVVRQALTESVLLSLFGGSAGLGIAFACTRVILRYAFPPTSGRGVIPISAWPSAPVLLFTFAISVLTGIVFGIAPAWISTRVDPMEALRGASRSTARTGSLARKMLVVSQVALSLVLLSVSSLLTAALHRLEDQDFGFEQDRRTIVHYDPRLAGYTSSQLPLLYRRIHDTLSSLPGVSNVALCIYTPLGRNLWGENVWAEGNSAPGPNDDVQAAWDRVTAGYFDAIGNPILKGRAIGEQDTATSPHVAVINEAFARKFFGHEEPIGKHFGPCCESGAFRQFEIVGVAKNARYVSFGDLSKPVGPFFFLPAVQHDMSAGGREDRNPGSHYLRDIVVVTRPGVTLPADRLRAAMAVVDPNLPIISIHSMADQVYDQFRRQRLIARLTSFFGVLSLVLASIGLYGVIAHNAARRTAEIGVRMALGANRADIQTLVLRGAFGLILFGLVTGLPLAFAAGRALGSLLYGINPYNPVVMLIAVLTLAGSALVASLIPAMRASSVSPIDALRTE